MIENVHAQRGLGPEDLAAIGTVVLHDHVQGLDVVPEVVALLEGAGAGRALPALDTELGHDLTDVALHDLFVICNNTKAKVCAM